MSVDELATIIHRSHVYLALLLIYGALVCVCQAVVGSAGHVNFNLSTEHRAARRADWDKWKEEKDRKEKEQREERERQQQKNNEAETKRLRQLTVHKAQPLPRYLQSKTSKVSMDKDTGSQLVVQK